MAGRAPARRFDPAWVTVAFATVAFGAPLALLVAYGFGLVQVLQGDPGPTLSVWQDFLTSPYLPLYLRSLKVALVTAIACTVLAFPVAYHLACAPRQKADRLLKLLLLPFVTSFLLRVLAWRVILSEEGALKSLSALFGLWPADAPLPGLLFNQTAVTVVLIYAWLPLAVLPIYASLMLADMRVFEAATDLGASRLTAFATVILPAALPGVVASFVLVFVPVNGEYVVPLLVGGTQGMLFGNAVANMFGAGFDWSLGAVLASFLFLVVLGLLAATGLAAGLILRRRTVLSEVAA